MPRLGGAAAQPPPRRPARRRLGRPAAALDLDPSRAAGEFTDELGRQALLRRRRPSAMDHAVPTLDGDLGPCASVAVHYRWLVVRPARPDLGLQHRPATRPSADIYRAGPRCGQGVLACRRRGAIDRSWRAAEAACRSDRGAARLAHILGSDCRSEPGETSSGGKLIMLWSTSPTMARCVPWPAYCCLRSAR